MQSRSSCQSLTTTRRAKIIGICGSHRTGKSTLAKAYAEKHGIKFIETGAAATFARLGLDPKLEYNFRTRLMIQAEILNDCSRMYADAGTRWITDRTPIDFMGYLLADISRANVAPEDADNVKLYMKRCYQVMNQHFSVVVQLQPGIPMIDAEGKAPVNVAYIEHLNATMLGLLMAEETLCGHFYIPRMYLELEERLVCLQNAVKSVGDRYRANVGIIDDLNMH